MIRRPARSTDAPALVDLYRTAENTDHPTTTPADIEDLLQAPGLDLATNSAVLIDDEHGDQPVGVLLCHPAPQPGQFRVQLAVHPADAERNVHELLSLTDTWLSDTTATLFQLPNSPASPALRAHGWTIVHSYTRLVADLADVPPPPRLPDTEVGQGDMSTVHRVVEDAVAGHRNHQRRAFADFLADQESRDGHDPALWLLAKSGGTPVGAVICRAPVDRAWVAWLGVLPEARGRGVAAALLGQAFAALRDRGHTTVGVDVDTHNETGAGRVYERAGMRSVGAADQWRKTY